MPIRMHGYSRRPARMHLHGPGGIWWREVCMVGGPHRRAPHLYSCIPQWVMSGSGGERAWVRAGWCTSCCG